MAPITRNRLAIKDTTTAKTMTKAATQATETKRKTKVAATLAEKRAAADKRGAPRKSDACRMKGTRNGKEVVMGRYKYNPKNKKDGMPGKVRTRCSVYKTQYAKKQAKKQAKKDKTKYLPSRPRWKEGKHYAVDDNGNWGEIGPDAAKQRDKARRAAYYLEKGKAKAQAKRAEEKSKKGSAKKKRAVNIGRAT